MSSTHNTTFTTSNFEAIFNAALVEYTSQTGKDLRSHPLASKIDRCDSAQDILDIFLAQAKTFDEFRKGAPKLIKSLRPLVSGLYTLSISAALSAGISLVCPKNLLFSEYILPTSLLYRCFPLHPQSFLLSVSFYPCVSSLTLRLPLTLPMSGITRRSHP